MAKVALICMYDNVALGLRTIANALYSNGHDVTVIHFKLPASQKLDCYLDNPANYEFVNSGESHSEVIIHSVCRDANMWTGKEVTLLGDFLCELKPDMIGLSTRSVYDDCIECILQQMKRVEGAITIAGGHDATFEQRLYLKTLDFACIGEGEHTLLKMAEAINSGDTLYTIENLAYLQNGIIKYNPLYPPDQGEDYFYVNHMDLVPHYVIEEENLLKTDYFLRDIKMPSFIQNDYTNLEDYFTMMGWGCIGDCSFCSAGRFYEIYRETGINLPKRRYRSIQSVIEELRFAKASGYKQIKFIDSYFMGPEKYLMSFFVQYKKEIDLPFFAQLYPQQILKNPDILKAACDAGLSHTVAGIQSASSEVNLNLFDRNLTNDNLLKYVNILSKAKGLAFDYHLITHNFFEDENDLEITLDVLKKLPKKNATLVLFRLRAFPRTKIHDMIESKENLKECDKEILDKRAVLCLMRYYETDDAVFNELRGKVHESTFNEVKKLYTDHKQRNKNSYTWTLEGWEEYHKHSWKNAEEAFCQAVALEKDNWKALRGRGWALRQQNRFEEAVSDFEAALKHATTFTQKNRDAIQEIYRGIGWCYYFLEDYKVALVNFENSLKFTDSDSVDVLQDVFRGTGWVHFKKHDKKNAIESFKKAIEFIQPDQQEILKDAKNGISLSERLP